MTVVMCCVLLYVTELLLCLIVEFENAETLLISEVQMLLEHRCVARIDISHRTVVSIPILGGCSGCSLHPVKNRGKFC